MHRKTDRWDELIDEELTPELLEMAKEADLAISVHEYERDNGVMETWGLTPCGIFKDGKRMRGISMRAAKYHREKFWRENPDYTEKSVEFNHCYASTMTFYYKRSNAAGWTEVRG